MRSTRRPVGGPKRFGEKSLLAWNIEELIQESRELKAKIQELEQENQKLRQQIASLKKQLACRSTMEELFSG